MAEYQVGADGRVQFTVPSFRNGCDVYLFGLLKTRDGSAANVRIVELQRDSRTVRKLSLSQIARLKKDETGDAIVRMER